MAPDLNSLPPSPAVMRAEMPSNVDENLALGSSDGAPSPLSTPASTPPNGRQEKMPNIIYIMADQLAAPQLKMYNPDSQILTPNLDALASKSVQFDSAYCPSPLCAPSRMSMITGLLPMQIGAYDNACQISSEIPTYAHYLRLKGYHTALAGKMHFVGDQLHGYETRLTSDIYPGDFGWVVDWDQPDTRLEWYHNASSILQAGVCIRSNQLDYDEEVMYRSKQFLYDHIRQGPDSRPFCLTVSLTHPHDPYTIQQKYWDLYEGVDIALPKVRIPREEQDPHSKRLLKVCDLWDADITDEQIKRARRAYYGAVSYVDDCVGQLLQTLKDCRLADDTIVIFSGDHGDMLGERGLWYKMSYFESSVRVPLLISQPKRFAPHRVKSNVSTLDILPTMCDLVGTKPAAYLPMDGTSLLPHMLGVEGGSDTVFAEYTGEGTIAPLMMIRRGEWKFVICPTDGVQLFNLERDPLELRNLAGEVVKRKMERVDSGTEVGEVALEGVTNGEVMNGGAVNGTNLNGTSSVDELDNARKVLRAFEAEAYQRWDFDEISKKVLVSQRRRRLVWPALLQGKFESWDYNPVDDGRNKYIRSHMHLDDLERMARYPPVDTYGRETSTVIVEQAGAFGQ